ncbi:glycosyltransferase [Pseudomonas alcaligenes]|uniref:glycosyltransferase n=1 Tax=Aquipseudomonas alcaligenes TaxID=43263 RepID=UPI00358EE01B
MKFLVYSEVTSATIASSLGLPDYSYYFVLRDFLPVLRQLGEVVVIERPQVEVDEHYAMSLERGERCLFLSFTPPHKVVLGLRCPTLPVFAWEFDSIPSEHWLDEVNQNWAHVLQQCGGAITHSALTVRAVRQVLGDDFPIVSIPSPVWDRYAELRAGAAVPTCHRIRVGSGIVLDTQDVNLEPFMPGLDAVAAAVANARGVARSEKSDTGANKPGTGSSEGRLAISRRYLAAWYQQVVRGLLPWLPEYRLPSVDTATETQAEHMEPANHVQPRGLSVEDEQSGAPEWTPQPCEFELRGAVFTALFNPYDGRKNWIDMLTAFCAAFRDNPEATLVFKLGHHDYRAALNSMLMCIARLPRFRCRVLVVHGFLEKAEFDRLIEASTFVVNASHGEGQCLPLMELMSCGKPAIAPRNSAMLDYIDEDVAFVVHSWLDATAWPHDPRLAYRTCRHQLDWSSLVVQYQTALHCYREEPERYRRMSRAAIERMQEHCSQASAKIRLQQFLNLLEPVCS